MTMKLRLRRPKEDRPVPERKAWSTPDIVGTDDSGSFSGENSPYTPERRTTSRHDVSFSSEKAQFRNRGGYSPDSSDRNDSSYSTSCSDEDHANSMPERYSRNKDVSFSTDIAQFHHAAAAAAAAADATTTGFGVDFSGGSFRELPETPVRDFPTKEPVWKKRLRYKIKPVGAAAGPAAGDKTNHNTRSSSAYPSKTLPASHRSELNKQKKQGDKKKLRHLDDGVAQEEADSETDLLMNAKPMTKTVSFDETGIRAAAKKSPRKKKSSRSKKQESKLDTTFEEESFDDLMRTNSSYSDIFLNIFEDEDFSLATPTIYTDATDGNSTISSRETSKKSRRKEKRRTSEKYNDEEEEDEFGLFSCKTSGLYDDLTMFTELFVPLTICNKPAEDQDERSPRGSKEDKDKARGRRSKDKSQRQSSRYRSLG